jgi:hypothetical protein
MAPISTYAGNWTQLQKVHLETETGSDIYLPYDSGECISESSKAIRKLNDNDKNTANLFGRKVDLAFYHTELGELSICEFKQETANETKMTEEFYL